jgi:hypothetical protein
MHNLPILRTANIQPILGAIRKMTADQKREARYRKLCTRCKSSPAVRRDVLGAPMWLHDSTVECKAAAEREEHYQADEARKQIAS